MKNKLKFILKSKTMHLIKYNYIRFILYLKIIVTVKTVKNKN